MVESLDVCDGVKRVRIDVYRLGTGMACPFSPARAPKDRVNDVKLSVV